MVAVGGRTASEFWPQIVSDVTGLEQEVPSITLGVTSGDAFLARVATGLVEPSTRWAQVEGVARPNPAARESYEQLLGL